MRSATAPQLAALASMSRSSHVRVFVDRTGAGVYADLTAISGHNWLDHVEINDTIDATGMSASVTLRREVDGDSVATLMESSDANNLGGSYVPLIDAGRRFYIEACVLDPYATPAPSDWVEVFRGRIDDVDFGASGNELNFFGRDQFGDLAQQWIEQDGYIGHPSGFSVESVIQAQLDRYDAAATVLYTPVSPGFMMLVSEQKKESLASALQSYVDCFGWMLRFVWDSGTSAWRLTLYDPSRAKTVPDHTFDADDYFEITRAAISRRNIRNAVRITYTRAGGTQRSSTVYSNPTSITKYGRQYLEIAESSTSQIDTAAEAISMGSAILSDLAFPSAEYTIRMPYFWPIELADLYRFTGNGVTHDTSLDLAVVGYRHMLSQRDCSTEVMVRGKPSSGYRRWLSLGAELVPRLGDSVTRSDAIDYSSTTGSNVILNPDFGNLTGLGDIPPDKWLSGQDNGFDLSFGPPSFEPGEWGAELGLSTDAKSGGRSIVSSVGTLSSGSYRVNVLHTGPFRASPGIYRLDAMVKQKIISGASDLGFDSITVYAIGYDGDLVPISGSKLVLFSVTQPMLSDDVWTGRQGVLITGYDDSWTGLQHSLDDSSLWYKIGVVFTHYASNKTRERYIDSIELVPVKHWDTFALSSSPTLTTTPTAILWSSHLAGAGLINDPLYPVDRHTMKTPTGEWFALRGGSYNVGGSALVTATTSGQTLTLAAYVGGASVATKTQTLNSGLNVVPFNFAGLTIAGNQAVQIYGSVSTGTATLTANADVTYCTFIEDR